MSLQANDSRNDLVHGCPSRLRAAHGISWMVRPRYGHLSDKRFIPQVSKMTMEGSLRRCESGRHDWFSHDRRRAGAGALRNILRQPGWYRRRLMVQQEFSAAPTRQITAPADAVSSSTRSRGAAESGSRCDLRLGPSRGDASRGAIAFLPSSACRCELGRECRSQ
jgi:hypothetical protein